MTAAHDLYDRRYYIYHTPLQRSRGDRGRAAITCTHAALCSRVPSLLAASAPPRWHRHTGCSGSAGGSPPRREHARHRPEGALCMPLGGLSAPRGACEAKLVK